MLVNFSLFLFALSTGHHCRRKVLRVAAVHPLITLHLSSFSPSLIHLSSTSHPPLSPTYLSIYISINTIVMDYRSGYNTTGTGTNSQVSTVSLSSSSTSRDFRSNLTLLQGNHYCNRDYGNGSNSYHYSNSLVYLLLVLSCRRLPD